MVYFQGGLLLAQYITIGRETVDVDFLMTKIHSEFTTVKAAISDIIATPVDDAFSFEWDSMEILSQPHMDYNGFRVTLQALFGGMKDKIYIDIGVGDQVTPNEKDFRPFEYQGKPLFVGEITMMVYPVESIFSEKLETIISKGINNSRMKDYHDIILMIREPGLLNISKLQDALHTTFTQRGTGMMLPVIFVSLGLERLQGYWASHIRGLGSIQKQLNLPEKINDLLDEINVCLQKLFLNQLE